ncbi:MAG: 16S rRNA (cytosine(1402)-N(4))-methyltransferase RsmH [Candidatus Pacebacteria bacterium]|nr:16S rRNA (cytosine(1402)-N(4))-methyltransferase RsmH [Candidatus Paceibacterota bacterium]
MNSIHKTVLLNEAIEGLNLSTKQVVVDGTFGGGGHSSEICKRYSGIKIIAIDQDAGAWGKAKDKFAGLDCDVNFVNDNFRNIGQVLKDLEIESVDGVLLDLGLSSDQLDNSGRGFSFLKNEPLLMTMKENPSGDDVTARDVVNTWEEKNLADIIYGYGEEKLSRRIAKAIVDAREKKPIETTFELVAVIEDAVGGAYKRQRIHPATRTFQAIRIAVNDELGTLSAGINKGFEVLKVGGRMAVISFHSLEDRIVKKFFKAKVDAGEGVLINKKVITAGSEEIKNNSRSRSAKLRIIEKNTAKAVEKIKPNETNEFKI